MSSDPIEIRLAAATAATSSTTTTTTTTTSSTTTTTTSSSATTSAKKRKWNGESTPVVCRDAFHLLSKSVKEICAKYLEVTEEVTEASIASLADERDFKELGLPFLVSSGVIGPTSFLHNKGIEIDGERIGPTIYGRDVILPLVSMAAQHPYVQRARMASAVSPEEVDRVRFLENHCKKGDAVSSRDLYLVLKVPPSGGEEDDSPPPTGSVFQIRCPVAFTSATRQTVGGNREGRTWGVITGLFPVGEDRSDALFRAVFADESLILPGQNTFDLQAFAPAGCDFRTYFKIQPFPEWFPAFWMTIAEALQCGGYFVSPNDDVLCGGTNFSLRDGPASAHAAISDELLRRSASFTLPLAIPASSRERMNLHPSAVGRERDLFVPPNRRLSFCKALHTPWTTTVEARWRHAKRSTEVDRLDRLRRLPCSKRRAKLFQEIYDNTNRFNNSSEPSSFVKV
jgi:hypothetical protein